jgi:hypothetical protein
MFLMCRRSLKQSKIIFILINYLVVLNNPKIEGITNQMVDLQEYTIAAKKSKAIRYCRHFQNSFKLIHFGSLYLYSNVLSYFFWPRLYVLLNYFFSFLNSLPNPSVRLFIFTKIPVILLLYPIFMFSENDLL